MKSKAIIISVAILVAGFLAYQYFDYQKEQKRIAIEREDEEKRIEEEKIEQERKRKVYHFAEQVKDKIIDDKFDGGINKAVRVNNWEYFELDDSYRVEVSLSWNGDVFTSNVYATDEQHKKK